MSNYDSWNVAGTYYEVCNCDAVCPCRRHGEKKEGAPPMAFVILPYPGTSPRGRPMVDLSNLSVVLAGSYNDDEAGSPWRVIIYVDERGNTSQQQALADIFLGRSGGDTSKNFASVIGEVYAIRAAKIALEHSSNQERMEVKGFVSAATAQPDLTDQPVSCGIPGHDRPGQEIIADHFRVDDQNLKWELHGRCGFATDFAYRS